MSRHSTINVGSKMDSLGNGEGDIVGNIHPSPLFLEGFQYLVCKEEYPWLLR
jgi:hypothetical protein